MSLVTWDGPQWKAKTKTTKKLRAKRTRRLKRDERSEKGKVRDRDKHCRFPRCGCGRVGGMKAVPTVSHLKHKGMGGNPKGERSTTVGMIELCKWRHQDARISRDKGTLRYVPLTDAGCDGPVCWQIDVTALPGIHSERMLEMNDWLGRPYEPSEKLWRTLAVETDINVWTPADDWADEVLDELAVMEV